MNRYFGVHILDGEWHALLPRYLLLGPLVEQARVLDLGCASGIGSSMLMEMGAEQVDGIDTRVDLLDLAAIKHAKQNLGFHRMDPSDLGFDDDTFEVVVGLNPDGPVTDPGVLAEVRRVLGDDGVYVCAIERRTVDGLEAILPRNDGHPAGGRRPKQAPQVGELSNHFETLQPLRQKPRLSWAFVPPDETGEVIADGGDDAEPDGDAESTGADEPPHQSSSPATDATLCAPDSEAAAVELMFCGDAELEAPSPREVRLPYYRVAERLAAALRDLKFRRPADTHGPDGAADSAPPGRDAPDRRALEARLREVGAAYDHLRQTVERMRDQTRAVLDHQARHLQQLGDDLQRARPAEGETRQDDEPTGVWQMPEPPDEASGETDTGEFPAQPDPSKDQADELRELQRQRDELQAELEARTEYIERLRERLDGTDATDPAEDLDESTTPEEDDALDESTTPEQGDDATQAAEGDGPVDELAEDLDDTPEADDDADTAEETAEDQDDDSTDISDEESDAEEPRSEDDPAGEADEADAAQDDTDAAVQKT